MPDYVRGALILGLLFIVFILTQNMALPLLNIFEWVTQYVLPWIALYWFIQFVKIKSWDA